MFLKQSCKKDKYYLIRGITRQSYRQPRLIIEKVIELIWMFLSRIYLYL